MECGIFERLKTHLTIRFSRKNQALAIIMLYICLIVIVIVIVIIGFTVQTCYWYLCAYA